MTFEERLENWGLYFRDGRIKAATSPTYDVCLRMAIEAGVTITDGYRELHAQTVIDREDAEIIEWCWTRSAYRMNRTHWILLRAHYVEQSDPRFICRVLMIKFRQFEKHLQEATEVFNKLINLLEKNEQVRKKRDL